MTCTDPGSDSKKAAAGSVAVAAGRMAVLMNPQSGSLQPAMLDGIAGGLGAGPSTLSTKPLTVLLAPVLVTTPEPVEFVMVPVLVPTKAPTVLLAPVLVTAPEAVESVMVPVLVPAKPPTVLLAPVLVTAPEAVEAVMAPALVPTKPPATLSAPTVTLPLACELVMVPLTEFEATRPPAMLPSPACTLPVATDKRIAPELLPTKPPA